MIRPDCLASHFPGEPDAVQHVFVLAHADQRPLVRSFRSCGIAPTSTSDARRDGSIRGAMAALSIRQSRNRRCPDRKRSMWPCMAATAPGKRVALRLMAPNRTTRSSSLIATRSISARLAKTGRRRSSIR